MNKITTFLLCLAVIASCTGQKTVEQKFQTSRQDAVVYEMNIRQATPEGTFAAVTPRLDDLAELGVDMVWIMPPYPIGELGRKGTMGSYYAIRDYCAINPEFGTLDDFDAFLDKAHSLGMRVILDWVANHTSPDHPWVTERPKEWYERDANGNTKVEYDWYDIAALNYDCADMRKEMVDCMSFWLERGIDGFRCDVAYEVPQDFWADAIPQLRDRYGADLYFLAEGEVPWLHEVGFDASYAWKFHHLINDIAQGKAGAKELVEYLSWNAEEYPADALRLSFTSNHDENSWAGTEFTRMGEAVKAMTVLCWTLPCTQPLIYTGQEIGYDDSFEFFEKDPIMEYKANDWTEFYRDLACLRHSLAPWQKGQASDFELISSDNNTLVYTRAKADGGKIRVSVLLESPWAYSIETE